MKEVAQRFEAEYLKDAAGLNCKKPTVQPLSLIHISLPVWVADTQQQRE